MIPSSSSSSTAKHGGGTDISALYPDIIDAHIMTRLDGPTLASTSFVSSALRRFSSQNQLWFNICHSSWPSTAAPRVSEVIADFPDGGPRAFFAHSFPVPDLSPLKKCSTSPPEELISAVDIRYRDKLIFTKARETETLSAWFQSSPFMVDLIDPKDVVPTPIRHPEEDDTCASFAEDVTLSWILIDPAGRRAVNLSSHKPVSVHRHWLSGEVQVTYASILAVDRRCVGPAKCGIVVTFGASEGGESQVREVSMQMEDIDGIRLNGKDSLIILQMALEGRKGNGSRRVEEAHRRFIEFLDMKRERRERRLRTEMALDILCVAFAVSALLAFSFVLLCR